MEDLFKVIREKGLKLCLMCTITGLNYKLIPNYCKKAVELGATAIKFTNFISQGNARNLDSKLILNEEQLEEFFEIIYNQRQKYDKEVLDIRRCGSFGNDLIHKCNFHCTAGTITVCITPDLKVYPCIFQCKQGNEIGFV